MLLPYLPYTVNICLKEQLKLLITHQSIKVNIIVLNNNSKNI